MATASPAPASAAAPGDEDRGPDVGTSSRRVVQPTCQPARPALAWSIVAIAVEMCAGSRCEVPTAATRPMPWVRGASRDETIAASRRVVLPPGWSAKSSSNTTKSSAPRWATATSSSSRPPSKRRWPWEPWVRQAAARAPVSERSTPIWACGDGAGRGWGGGGQGRTQGYPFVWCERWGTHAGCGEARPVRGRARAVLDAVGSATTGTREHGVVASAHGACSPERVHRPSSRPGGAGVRVVAVWGLDALHDQVLIRGTPPRGGLPSS